jgi:large subunit ribosomal protein L29
MKKAEIRKEIVDLTDKQLKDRLAEEQLNLTKSRLSHAVSPLENSAKLGQLKKNVARLKTEQRKRQANGQKANN